MADEPTRTATEESEAEPTEAPAASSEAEASAPSAPAGPGTALLFRAPPPAPAPQAEEDDDQDDAVDEDDDQDDDQDDGQSPDDSDDSDDSDRSSGEGGGESSSARRRRRRGGRRRRKPGGGDGAQDSDDGQDERPDDGDSDRDERQDGSGQHGGEGPGDGHSRRRRRRRREGDGDGAPGDDPEKTVTRVRKGRTAEDEITAVTGSTRLEAKKQRRREGREAGRRRAPIVSEAEFLARRESVDRQMVVRQRDDLTQIAVLEDKVLVEHYVARESQTSLIGNVYLGRVQNVLPSMEAAFVDIGKGRNAVLYAGEVNWSALGHKEGAPRKIESVLSSGQTVLVQVTKDPVGHKGARLTSQISLAGRFLVYVPDGTTSGISRKLPDTERARLKKLLKEIVPESAGVIVRTAAEGAAEEELTRDVERLKARWEDIEAKSKAGAPKLLYAEPDLTLKVVRDLFTEDFSRLVIQGDDAWDTVQGYVKHVAPDLEERLERYEPGEGPGDVFADYRIDEQIAKGLDRKVWLPSGGSLIIDRTEAMTVIDVNTGKFTGSGGNLEETVTKNNLEAAEEVVRQLRLRDIGGIIVIDFIDMVLESNRDLVLRRLVECLGRDRTRHQVAEVTSLGLVQMTRKRIGTGLLEAFSEPCPHCEGRGMVTHDMPVEPAKGDAGRRGRKRGGKGRGRGDTAPVPPKPPSPADVAAMAKAPAPEEETAAAEGPGDEESAAAEASEDEESGGAEAPGVGTGAGAPSSTSEDEEKPTAEVEEVAQQPSRREAGGERQRPTPGRSDAEAPVEPEQSAEPEPPKVVTRTRRAARRPAGTPETTEPSAPVELPEVPVAAAATTEPPKVVTRTRGRTATRQAGPPADETTEPGAEESVEHVPVKKKGSRKR